MTYIRQSPEMPHIPTIEELEATPQRLLDNYYALKQDEIAQQIAALELKAENLRQEAQAPADAYENSEDTLSRRDKFRIQDLKLRKHIIDSLSKLAIADGSLVEITYDTETDYEMADNYTTSNRIQIARKAGVYLISEYYRSIKHQGQYHLAVSSEISVPVTSDGASIDQKTQTRRWYDVENTVMHAIGKFELESISKEILKMVSLEDLHKGRYDNMIAPRILTVDNRQSIRIIGIIEAANPGMDVCIELHMDDQLVERYDIDTSKLTVNSFGPFANIKDREPVSLVKLVRMAQAALDVQK